MNAKVLILALFTGGGAPFLHAAGNLESAYRKNGEAVVAAFEGPRSVLQRSSAVMRSGRKEIAYGTVVSSDGFILTKASEVEAVGTLTVLVDTRSYEGHIVATDPVWDVALVRIEAQDLQPVTYRTDGDPAQGTWVVANGATSLTKRRALPGIISARPREIEAGGGAALGVLLKEASKSLELDGTHDGSGAREAGLQKGDVLLAIDGKKVAKSEDIAALLKNKKAGNSVKVTFRRADAEKTVGVRLVPREEIADQKSRNDEMSGDISRRRTGFPRVLQHDILGRKDSVGGPLLDLDGLCVGMNIARADRAQSYAIPAADLQNLAERLIRNAGK